MDVCVQLYGGFIAGQSNIIPSMWRKGNSSQISSVSSHHYLISACAASLCCVSSAFLSFRWAFPSYNYTLLSQRINALHPTFTHFTERPQRPQAKWEIHGLQTPNFSQLALCRTNQQLAAHCHKEHRLSHYIHPIYELSSSAAGQTIWHSHCM